MLQLDFHTCLQTDTKHNELEAGFSTGKQHVVVSRWDSTLKTAKMRRFHWKTEIKFKKSKHYSHRREVMHKSEYPEEAILHCKVARSQTSSLAVFLSPSFVGVQLSSLLQEQHSSFHSAGTPSGSKISQNSLSSALLQWASLHYYIWVDTTYQDMYFLSKKLVLKIFKRFASVSKMKVY